MEYLAAVNIRLERYSLNNYLLYKNDEDNPYVINNVAFKIVSKLDGTRGYDEIVEEIAVDYGEDINRIAEIVDEFLEVYEKEYQCKVVKYKEPTYTPISVEGVISYYPKAASIEITERCNLRCRHCYGSFGEHHTNVMHLEDVKQIIFDLADAGVRTIELTGGDISMHPNLDEIIDYTLSFEFDHINLLSNGILLEKAILDKVIANKNRIVVQIDLHSLSDDYLSWFTTVDGTCEIIKEKIEYLHNSGVELRVATIFTRKNLNELESIADWLGKRKIRWGVGLVEKLGRASEKDTDLFLTIDEMIDFQKRLELVNEKYNGMISIIDYRPNDYNCGAMTTQVVIDSYGDIKLCTMDNGSYFNNPMGNCIETSIIENYEKNLSVVKDLTIYQLPDDSDDECKKCEERYACGHCMLRHFINVKERNFECNWYKQRMPESVRNAFFKGYKNA